QLLRADALIAQRHVRGPAERCGDDGAEAEDRPGRPDHAIESGAHDAIEIVARFGVDALRDLAQVARGGRIAPHVALGEADDADLEALSELDRGAGPAGDFHAAAADVDDDRHLAGTVRAVRGGDVDEPRFFGARDDSRANARLACRSLEELAAVL